MSDEKRDKPPGELLVVGAVALLGAFWFTVAALIRTVWGTP